MGLTVFKPEIEFNALNLLIDPLRTERQMLAKKLEAAGVTFDAKTYNGVTHEFFGMAPWLPRQRQLKI